MLRITCNIAVLALGFLTVSAGAALGQGSFQNLDFESATVPVVPPGQDGGLVPIGNAFPGWNGSVGTNVQNQVLHNSLALGDAAIGILGPNYYSGAILEGSYTAVLQTGPDPAHAGSLTPVPASLWQAGTVPATARSILFRVGPDPADFAVEFNGQALSVFLLSSDATHQIFGADVSSLAGLPGQLLFTVLPTRYPLYNTLSFDAIQFSNLPIPEPSDFGLSALGALLLGWRALCRRR